MSGHRKWSEVRDETALARLREQIVNEVNGSDPGWSVKEAVLALIDRRLAQQEKEEVISERNYGPLG